MVDLKGKHLEHAGATFHRTEPSSNHRKALGYWLGFLKGILASNRVEMAEYAPVRAEAENFLKLLHDPDAFELIEDLNIWKDRPRELFRIIEDIVAMRSRDFVVESEKDQTNELYGFCAGIACDNHITPTEVQKLLKKLHSYPDIQSDSRVLRLKNAARLSIADGVITPEESADICRWISVLVGDSATDTGLATFGNVGVIEDALEDHSQIQFEKRLFVLTGRFSVGPRKVVEAMIIERLGHLKDTICRNTDYLCVAAAASRDWKHSHEGKKIIRAFELRDEGYALNLVHESTLMKALSM